MNVYQFKIALRNVKPSIWRRIEVESDMSLPVFAETLNIVMGWDGVHLSLIRKSGNNYTETDSEVDCLSAKDHDWKGYKVSDLFEKEGERGVYLYDYGDSWLHDFVLEKILPVDQSIQYPRCTGGKNSCPPEDCGGAGGYETFRAIMANPSHPQYREMCEWLEMDDDEYFDPTYFSTETVNEVIHSTRQNHDNKYFDNLDNNQDDDTDLKELQRLTMSLRQDNEESDMDNDELEVFNHFMKGTVEASKDSVAFFKTMKEFAPLFKKVGRGVENAQLDELMSNLFMEGASYMLGMMAHMAESMNDDNQEVSIVDPRKKNKNKAN